MSEIPRPELDTLILVSAEATDLAREAGLDREPWGEDLLSRWQRAVEEYAARWGVARA